jgi:hypothetical protein
MAMVCRRVWCSALVQRGAGQVYCREDVVQVSVVQSEGGAGKCGAVWCRVRVV